MKLNYIITGLLLCALISNASATIHHSEEYSTTWSVKDTWVSIGSSGAATNYSYYWWASITDRYPTYSNTWYIKAYSPQSINIYTSPLIAMDFHPKTVSYSGEYHDTVVAATSPLGRIFFDFNSGTGGCYGRYDLTVVEGSRYNITGNICGVSNIKLYINNSGTWIELFNNDVSSDSSYDYEIYNTHEYKIMFDAHEYIFACDGHENYNRDMCAYFVINFYDMCNNKLINATVTIHDVTTDTYPYWYVDPVWYGSDGHLKLLLGTDVNDNDTIDIFLSTKTGEYKVRYTAGEYVLAVYEPSISWKLDVTVLDDSTGSAISQAQVTASQDCSIDLDGGYKLTQTNGKTAFTGLSNENINLNVDKTGYNLYSNTILVGKLFNCWSSGAQVTVYMNATTGNSTDDFQNGTHNDSTADGTGNETLPSDHGCGCGIYFKNTDGKITNTIKDTDAYVDMYYWIKGSDATLKFQHQVYTYWYTDLEYSVANNSFEYRRILNANFSDYTGAYRGYIYNTSYDCNNVQKLYVINESYQDSTDYENLTSHCWIKNKLSGNEIDYRSDIKCVIYANSTNSSLLDITAHFMNQSTEVDSIVLNWADFVSGNPKWYYTWYPTYEYESGYNYTLNITGFDGHQLDTDEVWTADIIGNTLTVYVKDNHNTPLAYSTVFVQGWGSIALDSLTVVSITGLSDGNVQYKATKSGYLSSSWSNITLDGSDESVTCILTKSATESVTGYKLKDSEIKEFFIPLMYLLLIMILLGGLMNAAKK